MKLSKILSIVVIAIMLVASVSNVVLASGITDPSTIKGNTTGLGTTGVTTMGAQIVGLIQTIGSVVAVIVLVVLGVKYMMGSAEEKAEYKKTLLPYFIGAILLFAASNIAGIVFNAVKNLGSTQA